MKVTEKVEDAVGVPFGVALRGLAKGIVIISARHGVDRYAMTATAVTSLSFDPPSMLICVNETASIFPALVAGSGFYINILSCNDQEIAAMCSGKIKGEARFASPRWVQDADSIPYLSDAQAAIKCDMDGQSRYGTHGIFIGRVVDVHTGSSLDPLIYVDGCYVRLPDIASATKSIPAS